MRPIFEQGRRLVTALTQPRATDPTGLGPTTPATSRAAPAPLPVTMEMVQAVLGAGHYQVLGYSLPVSGEAVCQAGQMVPVAWKNNVPTVILEHSARRARFEPTHRGGQQFGELLLLKVAKVWDVWLRNSKVFMPLKVSQFINHDGSLGPDFETAPIAVKWGTATTGAAANAFVVETTRNAPWPGVPAIVLRVPKFYIFQLTGGTVPRAFLVKTLSPTPAPSGITDFSGVMQPSVGQFPQDFVLTADLDVVVIILVTRDPANPNNVALIWSTATNTLLTNPITLNGMFPLPAPPIATVSSTVQFHSIALASWDKTNKAKQILFASVTWIKTTTSNPPPSPTQVGTSHDDINSRYVLWYGDGTLRDIVPPQPDSSDWAATLVGGTIVASGFKGRVSAYSILDNNQEHVMGPQFMLVGNAHLVPGTVNPGFPDVQLFNLSTLDLGIVRIAYAGIGGTIIQDGTFFVTSSSADLVPLGALRYFRFVASTHLYSIPEGQNPVPTSPSDATPDPTVPLLAQRDMIAVLAPNVLNTAPVPVTVFYPPGRLTQDPTLKTPKLRPWSMVLPTIQDADNDAIEEVVQRSQTRTDYQLTGA